jgi:acetyl esterase/lipase
MTRPRPWPYALAAALAGAALLPAQPPPKPADPPPGVKALRDLAYVKDGHERQKLDLYLPEKADGPLPVVVWVHGGGWRQGSKEGGPAVPLAAKGYAVACVNYRLSQHAVFPAQIEDCKAAVRWLRAHAKDYNLDPDHFAAWGASAGGHLVALLGTAGGAKEFDVGDNLDQSSRVQAVVDWFGPTDFLTFGPKADDPNWVISQLLGGPAKDDKDRAAKAGAVAYVSKDAPPFLILHGDKDDVVPYAQSEELADALKKAGVDVTLKKVEGAGHGGPDFLSPDNRKLIEGFLDAHLKGKKD